MSMDPGSQVTAEEKKKKHKPSRVSGPNQFARVFLAGAT